jgi:hypothetical protein
MLKPHFMLSVPSRVPDKTLIPGRFNLEPASGLHASQPV